MKKVIVQHNKLALRVLLYVLLCSSFLSITAASLQLYNDYRDQVNLLEQRLNSVENSYLDAISSSLWNFNDGLIHKQINGIASLSDIVYVEIHTEFNEHFSAGNKQSVIEQERKYPITYQDMPVGELIVYANYQNIYQRIEQRAWLILGSEFFKVFGVAFLVMLIVHLVITRHLYRITRYSRTLKGSNLNQPLMLAGRGDKNDELDSLVAAINEMRLRLQAELTKLKTAEDELLKFSSKLEIIVFERTQALEESNRQLQQSLSDLTFAKDQLVQSEKMASLGQLVAGVSHEVNTPLGICITSISAIQDKVNDIRFDIQSEQLTKSKLDANLLILDEYQVIIESNLIKAVKLLRSFKSVAVDQHNDPELKINLALHIKDVVSTVKTLFKAKNYQVVFDIPDDIYITTFPSAWNQILTNLLMNSHLHGFDGRFEGVIELHVHIENKKVVFVYKDDGYGIAKELEKNIFDPFVTSKRGQGGCGLGLNIIYNLVHSKLLGRIDNVPCEHGVEFRIEVPLKIAAF